MDTTKTFYCKPYCTEKRVRNAYLFLNLLLLDYERCRLLCKVILFIVIFLGTVVNNEKSLTELRCLSGRSTAGAASLIYFHIINY